MTLVVIFEDGPWFDSLAHVMATHPLADLPPALRADPIERAHVSTKRSPAVVARPRQVVNVNIGILRSAIMPLCRRRISLTIDQQDRGARVTNKRPVKFLGELRRIDRLDSAHKTSPSNRYQVGNARAAACDSTIC
jgi:hypothetical protein